MSLKCVLYTKVITLIQSSKARPQTARDILLPPFRGRHTDAVVGPFAFSFGTPVGIPPPQGAFALGGLLDSPWPLLCSPLSAQVCTIAAPISPQGLPTPPTKPKPLLRARLEKGQHRGRPLKSLHILHLSEVHEHGHIHVHDQGLKLSPSWTYHTFFQQHSRHCHNT